MLPLADQIQLLTGATSWTLHRVGSLQERGTFALADGPLGVRGPEVLADATSLAFPSPSAVAATWDTGQAVAVGRLFAAEARRLGVSLVLGPLVNLQRTPYAGRHFEMFSEDPVLTGDLAVAMVREMQAHGVGACVKHFVANETEMERTSYRARVDPTTLREVYLAPFERVVVEGGAWSVMAAYSGVDDGSESAPMTEHHRLLTTILKGEWGFDGVVVSDWLATTSTVQSAIAGLDLVMPGPGGPWESSLREAVESGQVPQDVVADKAQRIIRLAERTRDIPDPCAGQPSPDADDAAASLRALAAQATVVLRAPSDGPLNLTGARSIALLGANAADPFVVGGGSSYLTPARVTTPAQALRAALPESDLRTGLGASNRRFARPVDNALLSDPVTGAQGVRIKLFDAAGHSIDDAVHAMWNGDLDLRHTHPTAVRAALSCHVRADASGEHVLSVGTVGAHTVRIDGLEVSSNELPVGADCVLDSSINNPPDSPLRIVVDEPRTVLVEAELQVIDAEAYGLRVRAEIRHVPPGPGPEELLREAEGLARDADCAVVVIGTTEESESEGWDRSSLAMPGHQDELVRRVVQANPRTVVVVNAGAPVILPWLDDDEGPHTVLWQWMPGQEGGTALADVLTGAREPAGRLPWTLPDVDRPDHVPTHIPDDGVLDYAEASDVGYRGWLRAGRRPARPFGFGLGWSSWTYLEARPCPRDAASVEVTLTNTGTRPSSEVVQVYAEDLSGAPNRPLRWLVGHARVHAAPGETVQLDVPLVARALQRWDEESHTWVTLPAVRLHVGRHLADTPVTLELTNLNSQEMRGV